MTRARGFSLVEVLAVLTVVAVTGAVTLPALFEGEDVRGVREARRLAAAVDSAVQAALLTGRAHAVILAPDGYRFEERDAAGAWQAARLPELATRRLDADIRIDLAQSDGAVLAPGQRLVFPPAADRPPFEIRLAHPLGQVRVVGAGLGESHVEAP